MKRIVIILIAGFVAAELGGFSIANAGCFDCQPQCVTYARERSGIYSCRGGGAIDWYNCSKRSDKTSSSPKKGRVCILNPDQNGIPSTGHALYVEKSEDEKDHKYSLRLAHTNFDCKCSRETNVKATYYSDKKSLKMKSGAWNGKTFKVAGFIKQ